MTRLTAPTTCSSVMSNFEDDDQSTSEYNGSSTLTPSTTQNGMNSNATTISSQTSLNDYPMNGDVGDCDQSSQLVNSAFITNNNLNNNHIDNNRKSYNQHDNDRELALSRQQSANYYGVNDLKEAYWRKQANSSGTMNCDFYGGSGKVPIGNYHQQQFNNSSNISNGGASRYGSQTSVNNDRLSIHRAAMQSNNTSSTILKTHKAPTNTSKLNTTMASCGDSLDDVSGAFDQMSVQSELIASSLARHHYESRDCSKYFESLSARESFNPSNIIMHHQPTTTVPKPTRLRDSPHLTRTYSMIGQKSKNYLDLDKSMTLNRHERRFITKNIASVLSKPRAPPTIPSIPQLSSDISSSHLGQPNNGDIKGRLASHCPEEYQPNTSHDDYVDARDSSFASCTSQPSDIDGCTFGSEKKKSIGTLSSLGSKITLATKGKTMQNQIANLKKFFSSIPKRKSFMNNSKKNFLFDTPDGDTFLDRRCPSAEAIRNNSSTINSTSSYRPDMKNTLSASCSTKDDIEYRSYNPTPYSNCSSDIQDRISISSNSSRLNYIKELHKQSADYAYRNNRTSWTVDTNSARDRKRIQLDDNAFNDIFPSNIKETLHGSNVPPLSSTNRESQNPREQSPQNIAPVAPFHSHWIESNLSDNYIANSTACLSCKDKVEHGTNHKKDNDLGAQHMAVVAPRSNSCSSRLSSIYAPTPLSSLASPKISSSQQRKTLPPPPPPPKNETNLDNCGYDSDPLPPPPSDLKVLSYHLDGCQSIKNKNLEHNLIRQPSVSDGDEKNDEEKCNSWHMSSLPIFQDRKLTTVYEEQPKKYQKIKATNNSSSIYLSKISPLDASYSRFLDSAARNQPQKSSHSFTNEDKATENLDENYKPSEKINDHNSSSELDADTTLVSNVFESSYEIKDRQKLHERIAQLELQLQTKEKSFTDLQLEQLSTAYLIDQLRSTIEKLEQENSHLKATLNRYHQINPGHVGLPGPLKIHQR